MRTDRRASCNGKVAFTAFTEAASSAKHINRIHDESHLAAYHCQICNRFHIGEQKRKRENLRQASQHSDRRYPEAQS